MKETITVGFQLEQENIPGGNPQTPLVYLQTEKVVEVIIAPSR
jgi:hypothetical protein